LQDEFIKLARAGRAFADALTSIPLPPNANTINIPKLTGGTSTGAQADLGAVSSQDITTSLVSFPVITIAGQEDLARQLFDRAVPELADMVLWPDLVSDYNTKLDVQAISGSGATPNATGALSQSGVPAGNTLTYTTGSPTLGGLYSKIAGCVNAIHTTRYLPPDSIWMHPRRWAWCLAQLDSQNRPLIVPHAGGPFNAIGNLEAVASQAYVGQMMGLPVYVDPSFPVALGAGTNQDVIVVARMADHWLAEDDPIKTRVFEEVLSQTLAVRIQCFNYAGLTFGRYPQSLAFVQGTGLSSPSF